MRTRWYVSSRYSLTVVVERIVTVPFDNLMDAKQSLTQTDNYMPLDLLPNPWPCSEPHEAMLNCFTAFLVWDHLPRPCVYP